MPVSPSQTVLDDGADADGEEDGAEEEEILPPVRRHAPEQDRRALPGGSEGGHQGVIGHKCGNNVATMWVVTCNCYGHICHMSYFLKLKRHAFKLNIDMFKSLTLKTMIWNNTPLSMGTKCKNRKNIFQLKIMTTTFSKGHLSSENPDHGHLQRELSEGPVSDGRNSQFAHDS